MERGEFPEKPRPRLENEEVKELSPEERRKREKRKEAARKGAETRRLKKEKKIQRYLKAVEARRLKAAARKARETTPTGREGKEEVDEPEKLTPEQAQNKKKRSEAAKKGWETRRNKNKTRGARSEAAKKGWETRRRKAAREAAAKSGAKLTVYTSSTSDGGTIGNPQLTINTPPRLAGRVRTKTINLTYIEAKSIFDAIKDGNDSKATQLLSNYVDVWHLDNSHIDLTIDAEYYSRPMKYKTNRVNPAKDDAYLHEELHSDIDFGKKRFINIKGEKGEIYSTNCLINTISYWYSPKRIGKHKGISPTSVANFLTPPTLQNLIRFFTRYDISSRIYDIAGTKIYRTASIHRSHPAIALMIHNNHVQIYEGDLHQKIDFSDYRVEKTNYTKPVNIDNRIAKMLCAPGFNYRCEKGIINPKQKPRSVAGLTDFEELEEDLARVTAKPNFQYDGERFVYPRSFSYERENYQPIDGENLVSFDRNKAFWTSLMSRNANTQVPVFTPVDEWVPYDGSEIVPYSYYILRYDYMQDAPKWQRNNFMHGFRIIQEIENHRLEREQIEYVKHPSYTEPIEKLQILMKDARNEFFLYNGRIGRVNYAGKFVSYQMNGHNLALLLIHHPHAEYQLIAPDYYAVRVKVGDSKFRFLNNRNFYNFIIDACNYDMQDAIDRLMLANPNENIEIVKIWVDCVCFIVRKGQKLDTSMFDIETWKREKDPVIYNRTVRFRYINIPEIIDAISRERERFMAGVRVITGAPGTGKTHYVKSNLDYDHAVSYTNVCSRLVEGTTIHRLFILSNLEAFYKGLAKLANKTVWLDEFSQVPAWIWSSLFIAKVAYNVNFIITGDQNQIPPYQENPNYNSPFFRTLLGGATVLTHNYRNDQPLQEFVKNLSSWFHRTHAPDYINQELPLMNLCFRRKVREAINKRVMAQLGYNNLSKGLRVAVKESYAKHSLLKGSVFTVSSHTDTDVTLKPYFPKGDSSVTLKHEEYFGYFREGYAFTIDSCQGLTINEKMAIHELDLIKKMPHSFNRIYTAVTRATKLSFLEFYDNYEAV